MLVVGAVLVGLAGVQGAHAGAPTEQLKGEIDKVIKTLQDPSLKDPDAKRQHLKTITEDSFDWIEIAKRALGRHWNALSDVQREEFVRLFRALLERTYLSKVEMYRGETVDYVGEAVDGDHAIVRTKILTKQETEVPVDYRMLRHGDRWLVYDIAVEGVSLVSNYRTQFAKIIQTSSYEELRKRLQAKLK
jgi:phospholipid transport system substrate-binding protein